MIVVTFVAALLVFTLIFYVAILRLPKWFVHSLFRHAQWRLRDDVMDLVLAGELDRGHEAVRFLMGRSDHMARVGRAPDFLELVAFSRKLRTVDPKIIEAMRSGVPSPEGLPARQVEILEKFNQRQFELNWGAVMLNSWPGLIATAIQIPGAVRKARRERIAGQVGANAVVQEVAFTAASKSHAVGSLVVAGLDPDAAFACA